MTEDKYPELASLLTLLMSEVRQKDVMYREWQKGLCQNLLYCSLINKKIEFA